MFNAGAVSTGQEVASGLRGDGKKMDQDIRLGTIDGIPVGMNWSILFIFVLLTWELADLILPDYQPHPFNCTPTS